MKLRRTANAGVLLELDGVSILLDGVCREVKPYPATPPEERAAVSDPWPDIVAFTHGHKDHYDPAYAAFYTEQTGRVVLGPAALRGSMDAVTVGGVMVTPVESRHIGAAGKDMPHASFVIRGSKTLWFLGDSSPAAWRNRDDLPSPDVVIVPYAYANTSSSWEFTKSLDARVILVHMPEREQDTIGLWDAVEHVVSGDDMLWIPELSQTISF